MFSKSPDRVVEATARKQKFEIFHRWCEWDWLSTPLRINRSELISAAWRALDTEDNNFFLNAAGLHCKLSQRDVKKKWNNVHIKCWVSPARIPTCHGLITLWFCDENFLQHIWKMQQNRSCWLKIDRGIKMAIPCGYDLMVAIDAHLRLPLRGRKNCNNCTQLNISTIRNKEFTDDITSNIGWMFGQSLWLKLQAVTRLLFSPISFYKPTDESHNVAT